MTSEVNRHSGIDNPPPFKTDSSSHSEIAQETKKNKEDNLSSSYINDYDDDKGYVDGGNSK